MKTKHRPILTDDQQALLDGVQMRLITPEEQENFDKRIVEGHYLHNADFVGEQLRYVAEYQGQCGVVGLDRGRLQTQAARTMDRLVGNGRSGGVCLWWSTTADGSLSSGFTFPIWPAG